MSYCVERLSMLRAPTSSALLLCCYVTMQVSSISIGTTSWPGTGRVRYPSVTCSIAKAHNPRPGGNACPCSVPRVDVFNAGYQCSIGTLAPCIPWNWSMGAAAVSVTLVGNKWAWDVNIRWTVNMYCSITMVAGCGSLSFLGTSRVLLTYPGKSAYSHNALYVIHAFIAFSHSYINLSELSI